MTVDSLRIYFEEASKSINQHDCRYCVFLPTILGARKKIKQKTNKIWGQTNVVYAFTPFFSCRFRTTDSVFCVCVCVCHS